MVHVFKRVSISDEEAEIRFFRVYGTPLHLSTKIGHETKKIRHKN